MFRFTPWVLRKMILVGAVTLAPLVVVSAAQPRAVVAAAVPAAAARQVQPPLTAGSDCLQLLAFFAGPASPWGPFGAITWSGNPAAYAGSLSAFLFGSPAAPGLLQVCAWSPGVG